MTFDSLRQYLDDAGKCYGYVGTFDRCILMLKTTNGLVPVESAQIQIDEGGIGRIVLSSEEPDGNIG